MEFSKSKQKRTSLLLAIIMVFGMCIVGGTSVFADASQEGTQSTSVHQYGDVNNDGSIDLHDVLLIQKHVAKSIVLTEEQAKKAEVSGDGVIAMEDVLLLQKYIAKLISTFPVEPEIVPTTPEETIPVLPTVPTEVPTTTPPTTTPPTTAPRPTMPPTTIPPIPSEAFDGQRVTAGDVVLVNKGDTVTYSVQIKAEDPLFGLILLQYYDTNMLQLDTTYANTGVIVNQCFSKNYVDKNTEGRISIVQSSPTSIPDYLNTQTVFTARFIAKESGYANLYYSIDDLAAGKEIEDIFSYYSKGQKKKDGAQIYSSAGKNTASAQGRQVFDLANQERVKAGEKPLVYNEDMQFAANIRAKEIAELYGHTRPSGAPFNTVLYYTTTSVSLLVENIAAGQRTADQVMGEWMNSENYKDNILSKSFSGSAVGVYEKAGSLYWVQLLNK